MKRKIPLENCHILSHKIALNPTKEQEKYLFKAASAARIVWNWTLGRWNEEYALWKEYKCGLKNPDIYALDAELNKLKNTKFAWLKEVSAITCQQEVLKVKEAFKKTFEQRKINKKFGFPKFKGKNSPKSFVAASATNKFTISKKTIRIPHPNANGKRYPLIIKMREELRFNGIPLSVTISLVGDRWFASIPVAIPNEIIPQREFKEVGIDLGSNTLAMLSDETKFENPKALKNNLKKLRQLNKAHSRKKDGSKNKAKSRLKLAKFHARVANIRKEVLHTTTTSIIKNYTDIGIESLNVKGMMANRKLSRTISDIGLYEFRRQLEYKAPLNGTEIFVADRWYPSSKKCFDCGNLNQKLSLNNREWICSNCGVIHDRDLNAAKNLRPSQINLHLTATHAELACGEESSGIESNFDVKLFSEYPFNEEKKQESSINLFDINGLEDSPHDYLLDIR